MPEDRREEDVMMVDKTLNEINDKESSLPIEGQQEQVYSIMPLLDRSPLQMSLICERSTMSMVQPLEHQLLNVSARN